MALRPSLPVQPHLYLADTLGRPLDGGKVFFGEINKDPEIHPIDVFYDADLTIAAPQPVRSKGGFMNASGDMVEIYAAEVDYSVKVLDSYGRQVFYKKDMSRAGSDVALRQELLSDNGVALVGGSTASVKTMADFTAMTISPIVVQLAEYDTGSNKGSGTFIKTTTTEPHNGGVIIHTAGGAIYQRQTDVIRWEDFGLYDGSPRLSKSNCEAALAWGLDNGFTKFETSRSEINLGFDFKMLIPELYPHKEIWIDATGVHKFGFDIKQGATYVRPNLFYIQGNSKTAVNINVNFNNENMVNAITGTQGAPTAFRLESCPNSHANVVGQNNNGWGAFINNSHNSTLRVFTRNVDGYDPILDNYGDAVYIASRNVSIEYADIETNRGGRSGICFEGTLAPAAKVGGSVSNYRIVGYARGFHCETLDGDMSDIVIGKGEVINCNAPILIFASGANKLEVTVSSMTSDFNDVITLPYGDFDRGHVVMSGGKLTTRDCTFEANPDLGSIVGLATWQSYNDTFGAAHNGLVVNNGTVQLFNLDASKCVAAIRLLYDPIVKDSKFGGDLTFAYATPSAVADNIQMIGSAAKPSGIITLDIYTGGIYRDITFDYVATHGIAYSYRGNGSTGQPVIDNIKVMSGASGSKIFKDTVAYRYSLPSVLINADGLSQIPPTTL